MPCDGKNPNCDRRRELLAQLKCLVSSMDRKKPCEWDEPPCPPPVVCPVSPSCCDPPCCGPVKRCKSFDFRASIMYRCECIKRNGLQDRCMMWDCMGRPECMTKLYPVCGPGRAALLKLTDLGDAEVALRKFYCADQAREAALAAYCRLNCDNTCQSSQPTQCCPKASCPTPCPPPCSPCCQPPVCIAPPACPPCVACCPPPPPPCIPCPPCSPFDSCTPCVPCPPPCPPPCPSPCPPCPPPCVAPCPSPCPPCPPPCSLPCPPPCTPPCPPPCLPCIPYCPPSCPPSCPLPCSPCIPYSLPSCPPPCPPPCLPCVPCYPPPCCPTC